LVQKAKEKFEKEYQLKHRASMKKIPVWREIKQ
jgi:hypothetical protein